MSDIIAIVAKKRGRPLGAIREVYFIVSAVLEGELIQEKIQVSRGELISEDMMRLESIEIFKKQHSIHAEASLGPFFEAKLTQSSTSSRRETPKFSEENINLSNRKIEANYNNWAVIGRYFTDETQPEESQNYVRLTFKHDLTTGEKPRAKPHDTFKAIADLENIRELT